MDTFNVYYKNFKTQSNTGPDFAHIFFFIFYGRVGIIIINLTQW